MKKLSVHAILSVSSPRPMIEWGEEVEVCGWVRTKRDSKNVSFIVLYDGSTFNSLQVVVDSGLGFERLVQFVTGMKNIGDVVLYPRTPGNI